jgi:hypothetical protein
LADYGEARRAKEANVKRIGEQINDGGDEIEEKELFVAVIEMPGDYDQAFDVCFGGDESLEFGLCYADLAERVLKI